MTSPSLRKFDRSPRHLVLTGPAALSLAIVFALAIVATPAAQAQTYTVIHTFTGADGAYPQAGLTIDSVGNLYGTTVLGGNANSGTVFKLSHFGSGWIETMFYSFTGGYDGAAPGRMTIVHDGTLFGTTSWGGSHCDAYYWNCGTVFHLTPPSADRTSALARWSDTVLYSFAQESGSYPNGDLIFDQSGNLYGTTVLGGPAGNGVVYQLTPSDEGWVGTVLYSFQDIPDGKYPTGGVLFDKSGNLYGVAQQGGRHEQGTIYQLSLSGSSWTEQTLHEFTGGTDGGFPAALIMDASGNLYGTAPQGGSHGGGTIFKLTPGSGGWIFNNLYSFSGCYGCGPGALVMDAAGNFYGTSGEGMYGYGNVFKLTSSSEGWRYTSLHDFTGRGDSGGAYPTGLVLDVNGNLYGTTDEGGAYDMGVVFEITP